MVIDAALLDERSYHEAVSMVLTGVVVSRNKTKIMIHHTYQDIDHLDLLSPCKVINIVMD